MEIKRTVLLTSVLLTMVLTITVLPATGHAQGQGQPNTGQATMVALQYQISPQQGDQTLAFDTGTPGPLFNLRFIMGGHPDIKIRSILGVPSGSPGFTFSDASPFDITVIFAQNPSHSEAGGVFNIVVNYNPDNPARWREREARLEILAQWE